MFSHPRWELVHAPMMGLQAAHGGGGGGLPHDDRAAFSAGLQAGFNAGGHGPGHDTEAEDEDARREYERGRRAEYG